MVKDFQTQMGHADFIEVREGQAEPQPDLVWVFNNGKQLSTYVAAGTSDGG
jgi:hypothetical protein